MKAIGSISRPRRWGVLSKPDKGSHDPDTVQTLLESRSSIYVLKGLARLKELMVLEIPDRVFVHIEAFTASCGVLCNEAIMLQARGATLGRAVGKRLVMQPSSHRVARPNISAIAFLQPTLSRQ